jgi:hypothetical protein
VHWQDLHLGSLAWLGADHWALLQIGNIIDSYPYLQQCQFLHIENFAVAIRFHSFKFAEIFSIKKQ